jgi:hypothetical protein
MVRNRTISRRRCYGGSSIEYLTVLALVVLPLVLMMNTVILHMFWTPTPEKNKSTIIPLYEHRVQTAVTLPVG